jgi:hypothetical protein
MIVSVFAPHLGLGFRSRKPIVAAHDVSATCCAAAVWTAASGAAEPLAIRALPTARRGIATARCPAAPAVPVLLRQLDLDEADALPWSSTAYWTSGRASPLPASSGAPTFARPARAGCRADESSQISACARSRSTVAQRTVAASAALADVAATAARRRGAHTRPDRRAARTRHHELGGGHLRALAFERWRRSASIACTRAVHPSSSRHHLPGGEARFARSAGPLQASTTVNGSAFAGTGASSAPPAFGAGCRALLLRCVGLVTAEAGHDSCPPR